MMLQYALYFSVVLCWGLNIFFLALFALNWHESEPSKTASWLAMGAVAALALGLSCLLPARGGYDNNHDFLCLGQTFFTTRPGIMLSFKEVSPLFTDGIADFLSANSLTAVLWKNRLLPVLTLFVFFTGLRRLGAGVAAAAAASAFFFLNFLSPLNASSFATTYSNIFIWALSLLAIFDAWASPGPGAGGLLWIMSSLVLVAAARIEFLPVNLLLLTALAAAKTLKGNRFLLKPLNLAVIAAGAVPAAAWAWHAVHPSPANQVDKLIHPLTNLLYQLGSRNLAVIAGAAPELDGLRRMANSVPTAATYALCAALLVFVLAGLAAGFRADPGNMKPRLGALALLALWIGYFSAIFQPMDFYPLHFMRHQLYFFVPFAYLFALGLDGFARAAGGAKRLLAGAGLLGMAAYAALNAAAALGFNRDLRTNDRELEFLMEAQRDWPAKARAVHPIRNRMNARAELLQKYFPQLPDCPPYGDITPLKYVSPEPAIFRDSEAGPLEQAPLLAGPAGAAWKTASFPHAFYTAFSGRVAETEAPVPLTIGFFRLDAAGRDRAFLGTLEGVCAFSAGRPEQAAAAFSGAVAADPACANCRYFLALSYAALGKKDLARAELLKTGKSARAGLPAAQRALVEALASGNSAEAARLVREISGTDPEFFFRKNFLRGIEGTGPGTDGR